MNFKGTIDRMNNYGTNTLPFNEILEILSGVPSDKLQQYIDVYGIIDFSRRLDAIDVTDNQRARLKLIYEAARQIGSAESLDKYIIDSGEKAGRYFKARLMTLEIEHFEIALLDTSYRLIRTLTMSEGTIDQAAVFPREILKAALIYNAKVVILAHNHPSESITPSIQDIALTTKIIDSLAIVQIKLLDHIIVAGSKYVSFHEQGYM